MSAEDQAAIAAALAEDDAPASPEVRRPDATQSPEALVGPPSSVGGLLEGLMNAPGGAAALAHAFQARQNAQRAARDDIYDSDDEDRGVARRLQDDYDEEEDDDDEALARRLQDGDEEGDARLARRLAGQRGSSVNDGDAVLAAFLGGGGPPPLERRLSTGEDDPALQRALLQSTRPQQSAFAAGVDAQLERALAASRAEAGLAATERWDAPGPASPGGADDDDAALQAALLESAPPQQSEEERQIAEAIRLSALEAAPEEVLMTDAAATGARRLNRRRGSSDPDERSRRAAGFAQDGQTARADCTNTRGPPRGGAARRGGSASPGRKGTFAVQCSFFLASQCVAESKGGTAVVFRSYTTEPFRIQPSPARCIWPGWPSSRHACQWSTRRWSASARSQAAISFKRPLPMCGPARWTTFSAQGVGHSPCFQRCDTTRGGCLGGRPNPPVRIQTCWRHASQVQSDGLTKRVPFSTADRSAFCL